MYYEHIIFRIVAITFILWFIGGIVLAWVVDISTYKIPEGLKILLMYILIGSFAAGAIHWYIAAWNMSP